MILRFFVHDSPSSLLHGLNPPPPSPSPPRSTPSSNPPTPSRLAMKSPTWRSSKTRHYPPRRFSSPPAPLPVPHHAPPKPPPSPDGTRLSPPTRRLSCSTPPPHPLAPPPPTMPPLHTALPPPPTPPPSPPATPPPRPSRAPVLPPLPPMAPPPASRSPASPQASSGEATCFGGSTRHLRCMPPHRPGAGLRIFHRTCGRRRGPSCLLKTQGTRRCSTCRRGRWLGRDPEEGVHTLCGCG